MFLSVLPMQLLLERLNHIVEWQLKFRIQIQLKLLGEEKQKKERDFPDELLYSMKLI